MYFEFKNKQLEKDIRDAPRGDIHAKYAPSSAEVWFYCTGSTMLPDSSGEAAIKGRELHQKAYNTLASAIMDERVEGNDEYVDYVLKNKPENGRIYLEHFLGSDKNDIFGTVDCIISTPDKLKIIDLKTGKYPVEPDYNKQLGCYLALYLKDHPEDAGKDIEFVIAQGEIKSWQLDKEWFESFKNDLIKIIKHDIFFKVGINCNNCFKKSKCQAFNLHHKRQLAKVPENQPLSDIDEPTLIKFWQKSEILKQYQKEIKKELEKRHDMGKLEMIEKKTYKKVKVWIEEDAMKNPNFYIKSLMTVNAAIKKFGEDNVPFKIREDKKFILKEV